MLEKDAKNHKGVSDIDKEEKPVHTDLDIPDELDWREYGENVFLILYSRIS